MLLSGLFICHYLGDFVFTTKAMLKAKSNGSNLLPILFHASVHATLMCFWLLVMGNNWKVCTILFFFQLITHFLIDVGKGKISQKFPKYADIQQKSYWLFYGFDQLLHALVILIMYHVAQSYVM